MNRRRVRWIIAPIALAVVATTLIAWAYWSEPGTGSASASTGALDAPAITVPSSGINTVTVTWTQQASLQPASSENSAITYAVERKLGSGSWAAATGGGCSGARPHGTTNCTDALTASGSYSYRVVATYRTWTATSSEAGPVSVTFIPAAPTLNTVTAQNPASGQTTGAIAVSWSAVSGAAGYNVYRRTTAGSFDYGSPLNGATSVSASTYTDPGAGLAGGTTYHYVVRAVAGSPAQESASSNELNATAIARPAAPSGPVTATALASSRVGVAWSSVANVAGYNVYRRTSTGSYDFNAPLNIASPVTDTSYTDTTTASGTTYLYTVRAVISGAGGAQVESASSAESNTATASGAAACDYPGSVQGTTGLASYWRLGETSGTTAADSKGSNTGTYTNGVTLGATGAIAGDTNKSAGFDGVNDFVNVPDSASLKPLTQISMEAWVKPNAGVPDFASVATKTTLNTWSDGYGMYAYQGGIDFWVNDDANDVLTAALPTGTWSHIVGTYNGTTVRIYLNGVLVQSFAYAAPLVHLPTPLKIGDASGTGNYHWPGGIDDVAVYNTALSASTIQSRFRCGQRYRDVVLGTSGLTSYWRLGESAGTGAFDSKGANNGAFANGVTLGAGGALTAPGDTAASFDGTDDHVSLGDPTSLKLANPSVEAWVKTSDTQGTLFRARYNGYQIYVSNGDPHFAFTDSAGNSYVAWSTTNVNDNAWHHLVGTYDGATVRLYMDGVEVGSVATSAAVHYPGGGMAIGRDGDSDGNYLAGTFDEPGVYNRALTATEVAQHFRAR